MDKGVKALAAAQKKLNSKKMLIFKKPDHFGAIQLLKEAEKHFKMGKAHAQLAETYLLMAKSYADQDMKALAGQSYTHSAHNLALSSSNLKADRNAIEERVDEAVALLRSDGSHDGAADALMKFASWMAEVMPGLAADAAEQAADIMNVENRNRQGGQYLRQAAVYRVQGDMLGEAIETMHKCIGVFEAVNQKHNVGKMAMMLVAIHCSRGDVAEAQNVIMNHASAIGADEGRFVDRLTRAIELEDEDMLEEAKGDQCVGFLEKPLVRLIKVIRIRGAEVV